MKSIYPISTSSYPTDSQTSWEFSAVGVEYLFMADSRQNQGQNTEGRNDFRHISIDVLNSKPQSEITSGRYKDNVVPK